MGLPFDRLRALSLIERLKRHFFFDAGNSHAGLPAFSFPERLSKYGAAPFLGFPAIHSK